MSNKISTFGGKVSTLAEKFFALPDIQVRQTSFRIEIVEFFPPQLIIFHFQKKKNIPKSHELEHSGEVEIFPLLVENFHFSEICFRVLDLRVCKIWAQSGKVDFKKLQKKKLFQNHMNWVILHRKVFSEKSEIFPLFPLTKKFRKFLYPGLKLCKVSVKNIFWKK